MNSTEYEVEELSKLLMERDLINNKIKEQINKVNESTGISSKVAERLRGSFIDSIYDANHCDRDCSYEIAVGYYEESTYIDLLDEAETHYEDHDEISELAKKMRADWETHKLLTGEP